MESINKIYEEINTFEKSECSCEICKEMCERRPCWGTPKDIKTIIEKGHSNRLMLDWWTNDDETNTYILAPAIVGYESKRAPFYPTGKCTFYKNGKCEIHELKPTEGKTAIHNPTKSGMHSLIAKTWGFEEGKNLVKMWEKDLKT